MRLFLFTLFFVGAAYALWEYAIQPAFLDDAPRSIQLTNEDGNKLQVTLLKRDTTHVYFRRDGDATLHRYPVEQLNLLSRCKVWLFPKTAALKEPENQTEFNLAQTHLNAMLRLPSMNGWSINDCPLSPLIAHRAHWDRLL